MIKVAVIGCGYWGPNLVRNFSVCPDTQLVAVCDKSREHLAKVLAQYPGVDGVLDVEELLARPDMDAVAIATPVGTHYPFALAALRAGKHVLVEKPLAASVREAEDLVRQAEQAGRILMVDHTFIFSGAVQKIKELIDTGQIGDLQYIDSVRINLGLFQHDVNVIWDLAPHDLSIVDHLLGRVPRSLSAFGTCHTPGNLEIEDVAHMNLDFGAGLLASFHVSWLSPVKIRQFIVGGRKKSVVYNDLEPVEKVKVYDHGITVAEDLETRRGILIGYRTGDIWSPKLDSGEPLQKIVKHFAECIQENKTPLTGGAAGVRVVRILEAAQRSIKAQGGRITL